MVVLLSQPQSPFPWPHLLLSAGALWVAPVALGLGGLALGAAMGRMIGGEPALVLWFHAYALLLSPLFSWVGWLIALPPVASALHGGWFGWASAAVIGAASGAVAGALTETELALPFGLVAILALRAVLGRLLPL